jgi:hypothetical protein
MNVRSLVAATLASSLLIVGCVPRSRAAAPAAAGLRRDPPIEQRPPPGTRIETWPDLGAWSITGQALPGSGDLFPWEKAAADAPPKAQIPHRLHRPVD